MFKLPEQDTPLPDRRIRHVLSMRIALVVMLFFSAAWCLLQWTLATEPRFMAEGLTRQFVLFEATMCAAIGACAFLHLAASGLRWLITLVKMRRFSSSLVTPHLTTKHPARIQG